MKREGVHFFYYSIRGRFVDILYFERWGVV